MSEYEPMTESYRNSEFNLSAWASCLLWAVAEPDILARFKHETGVSYAPPKNGLEAMIDKAANLEAHVCRRFIAWFNENIWGSECVPDDHAKVFGGKL